MARPPCRPACGSSSRGSGAAASRGPGRRDLCDRTVSSSTRHSSRATGSRRSSPSVAQGRRSLSACHSRCAPAAPAGRRSPRPGWRARGPPEVAVGRPVLVSVIAGPSTPRRGRRARGPRRSPRRGRSRRRRSARRTRGDRGAADDDLGPGSAARTASTTSRMLGMVVVSSARHADEVGIVLGRGGDELSAAHVDAEVDDARCRALPHHPDEVLPDVVEVALDGAHDRGVSGLTPAAAGPAPGSPCRPSSPGRR